MRNPLLERIPAEAGSTIRSNHYIGRVFDCPYHYHPEIEIVHILQSEGTLVVGDHLGRYTPGTLYLFAPNVPHMFKTRAAEVNEEPLTTAESLYVQFPLETLPADWLQLEECQGLAGLLERGTRGLRFSELIVEPASRHLSRIHRSRGSDRFRVWLDLLFTLAADTDAVELATGKAYPRHSPAMDTKFADLLDWLDAHLDEPLDYDALARRYHYTPSGFSRFFKRMTGRTFSRYVADMRLDRARRRILDTDRSVTEICYASGFGNLSHFNRLFRSRFGSAPLRYRKQYLAETHAQSD